jgi:hypothetical protein
MSCERSDVVCTTSYCTYQNFTFTLLYFFMRSESFSSVATVYVCLRFEGNGVDSNRRLNCRSFVAKGVSCLFFPKMSYTCTDSLDISLKTSPGGTPFLALTPTWTEPSGADSMRTQSVGSRNGKSTWPCVLSGCDFMSCGWRPVRWYV